MEVLAIVGAILGGLLLYGLINAAVKAPGIALAKKFASLGDLRGRSLDEIVRSVGPFQSRSQGQGEGHEIIQWLQSGYHISLLFQDEVCEGVSHEFLAT